MAPALAAVHRQHQANNLEVVTISRGGEEINRAKAKEHGLSFPVLLQRRWEISKEHAIFVTPVGYLIDEHEEIAKNVVVGSEAILQLV